MPASRRHRSRARPRKNHVGFRMSDMDMMSKRSKLAHPDLLVEIEAVAAIPE